MAGKLEIRTENGRWFGEIATIKKDITLELRRAPYRKEPGGGLDYIAKFDDLTAGLYFVETHEKATSFTKQLVYNDHIIRLRIKETTGEAKWDKVHIVSL